MCKVRLSSFLFIAALLPGLVASASATTVTITGGLFSGVAGANNTSFDTGLPASYTPSGSLSGTRTGSLFNVYLTPTDDTTPYAYVGPNSSITATLPADTTYFGLYWGSPDDYNTLTFTDANGVTTIYGAGGTPVPGLVTNQMTAVYVNFFDTGAPWTSVTWTTGGAAFEFDNVATATATATPEPMSIFLAASGLLAIGAGAIRRRKA